VSAALQSSQEWQRVPGARGASVVLPGQSPEGAHVLSVLLKRSYHIADGGHCQPMDQNRALVAGDVFWAEPMSSAVRYESDFIPFKTATDVVLNGTVHAPDQAPTTSCMVSLQVGAHTKSMAVIGDRTAHYNGGGTPLFSDPKSFTKMELRYERAYGGVDVYSDPQTLYPYPRNPLGCGFAVANSAASIDGLQLPNLEDPAALITPGELCLQEYANWESRPLPAGFGWIAKTWLPRAAFAGVMPADRAIEQEMRRAYAQLVPKETRNAYLQNGIRDMDFRFFNGASPGLVLDTVAPGELIVTNNLTDAGQFYFYLPGDAPRLGLDIGEGVQEPDVALHTVMIDMDELRLDLVWRGAVPYRGPDWLPQMRKMEVLVSG
jgi:hypothetical protein